MKSLLPLFALLAACGDSDRAKPQPTKPVSGWQLEWSQGGGIERAADGFVVDVPGSGHVNYVTMPTGSLEGKTRIRMTYRSEGRLIPTSDPAAPTIITLYFQRRGDDWSGKGQYEQYRWYASFASHIPIGGGEIVAPLDPNAGWTAIQTSRSYLPYNAGPDPNYIAALKNADRVGFVLGGGTGLGHGITGSGKIVVTSFTVE